MAIEPSENVGTKLLFENERVRVWDLALQPGEAVEKHIHRLDYLLVILQGGDLRHVDPDNPENDRAVHFETDQVHFSQADKANGGTIHHRLINVGDAPYRNLVIELKEPG
ncbi:MAG TPA: hypothetical protein VGB77_00730 [Abditibacteriaceae bacterium]|jgi:predicted metal-dependent enzyme (double-stranded beta helix superfamily)